MATINAKKQDLPPEGGYRPINYKRVPARTYFKGRTIIAGYLAVTGASAYLYYLNCVKNHREEIEMRSAAFAVYPILLAERDREYLKQLRRNRDEEAKLMANVEGWKVGTLYGEPIYKSYRRDKLVEPTLDEYFVHAKWSDYEKRAAMANWS